uniref:LOW QUALITY PROTEIN: X-box-binding protein 1 n=1 Tax=Jaculus jaculus TaxID=51337 RepID=UPI001E1B54EF|nr:LOW QUALITY PROTEIN: X-box-binding protein 1 [Jaculus jaculus]
MVVVAASPSAASGVPKVLLLSGQPAAAAAAAGDVSSGRVLPLMVPGQRRASSPEAASGGQPQARKRQRLTHLSPEEKALRRKLKNRVAAQTARDRKKARMSELEQQVVDLEEENQKLLLENQLLREKTHGLVIENQELRLRLGMDTLVTKEEAEAEGNGVRPVAGSAESAALRLRASAAGAGPVVTPPEHLPMDSDAVFSSDTESGILLGFLDKLDPIIFFRCPSPESTSLEELPEICPEGPSSLPASLSLSVGTSSAKLEAINELIRFDHVYTKPLVVEIPSETESQNGVVVKVEEAPTSPSKNDHPELVIAVKEEPLEEDLIPELGISNLLSSSHCLKPPSYLLDAYSDCGYGGSPSPFSDMSSPLADNSWEDTFASELFPQLITV